MPARTAAPPRERDRDRDYDFSDVGKVGRRTGVTLAPRTVDEHGLENMTGLFSSPEKASAPPNSDRRAVMESVEAEDVPASTPRSVRSLHTPIANRESARGSVGANIIPRSASPRKSGITGSARRIGRRESILQNYTELEIENLSEQETTTESAAVQAKNTTTPRSGQSARPLSVRPGTARPGTARRFDPDSTPLRNMVLGKGSLSARSARPSNLKPTEAEPATNGIQDATFNQDNAESTGDIEPELERSASPQQSPPSQSPDIPPVTENGIVVSEAVLDMLDLDSERVREDKNLEMNEVSLASEDHEPEAFEAFSLPQDYDSDAPAENDHEESRESIAKSNPEASSEDSAMDDVEEHDEPELPPIPPEKDDEDDEDFSPALQSKKKRKSGLFSSNIRRKRKSDSIEEPTAAATSSPAAKRAKRRSDQGLSAVEPASRQSSRQPRHAKAARQKQQSKPTRSQTQEEESEDDVQRQALKSKPVNTHMSDRQRKELDGVVDRIRARPNQNKTLFVLRRETPADENVAHTRSGRISIKPLAWWRNEGIVYGNSPSHVTEGQRFPMNSIKEIIRTEESAQPRPSKPASKSKHQKKRAKSSAPTESADEDESSIDLEDVGNVEDPHAEDWEHGKGILRGTVSVWDQEQQAPIEATEECDIARAPAALQSLDVTGAAFKYAKLLTSRFFGAGIVDLPVGGIKKPKNSRKMHMTFFVVQGRVTVEVGPLNSDVTKFSIGKGGFWQVPRGNQYSIENEQDKPARIFFSQACDLTPEGFQNSAD